MQRISDEGKTDSGAVRGHRRGWRGHEVVGVDDDRRVPSGFPHGEEEIVQEPQAGVHDPHVVLERVPRRGDLRWSANQERVAGLGEEAPVVDDARLHWRIDGLLEKHGPVARVVHEPGQEFWRRLERPLFDLERADEVQSFQGFVEREQIAPLQHRTEEGGRPRSRCAPECVDRHSPKSRLPAG
jgi:hypothetical protein